MSVSRDIRMHSSAFAFLIFLSLFLEVLNIFP